MHLLPQGLPTSAEEHTVRYTDQHRADTVLQHPENLVLHGWFYLYLYIEV